MLPSPTPSSWRRGRRRHEGTLDSVGVLGILLRQSFSDMGAFMVKPNPTTAAERVANFLASDGFALWVRGEATTEYLAALLADELDAYARQQVEEALRHSMYSARDEQARAVAKHVAKHAVEAFREIIETLIELVKVEDRGHGRKSYLIDPVLVIPIIDKLAAAIRALEP